MLADHFATPFSAAIEVAYRLIWRRSLKVVRDGGTMAILELKKRPPSSSPFVSLWEPFDHGLYAVGINHGGPLPGTVCNYVIPFCPRAIATVTLTRIVIRALWTVGRSV